jgi:ERCC4-type nuclease
MLIVDSREDQSIIRELKERGVEFRVDTLNYGDYIILGDEAKFVIERKSITDFMDSVNDNRIWSQLKGLEQYKDYHIYIVIEGFYDYNVIQKNIAMSNKIPYFRYWKKYASFTPSRFIGTITSIMKSWSNVSIISVKDKPKKYKSDDSEGSHLSRQFIDFLISLNKKLGEPTPQEIWVQNVVNKNNRTLAQEQVDLLASIEGVGKVKVKEIIEQYKSIKKLVNAKFPSLEKKFGTKLANHLREVFDNEVEFGK